MAMVVSIPIGFSSSLQRLVLLWHELDQISFNPYRVFKFVATWDVAGKVKPMYTVSIPIGFSSSLQRFILLGN